MLHLGEWTLHPTKRGVTLSLYEWKELKKKLVYVVCYNCYGEKKEKKVTSLAMAIERGLRREHPPTNICCTTTKKKGRKKKYGKIVLKKKYIYKKYGGKSTGGGEYEKKVRGGGGGVRETKSTGKKVRPYCAYTEHTS